jgi:hypothetical protein
MSNPRITSVFTLAVFAMWSLATELRDRVAPRRPPPSRPAAHVVAGADRDADHDADRMRWN